MGENFSTSICKQKNSYCIQFFFVKVFNFLLQSESSGLENTNFKKVIHCFKLTTKSSTFGS